MRTYYVIPSNSDAVNPPAADTARAEALTASLIIGDPTGGQVAAFPSVVVISLSIAPQVIPDDQGQATLAEVQAAQQAATAAEQAQSSGIATANANLQKVVAQLAPGLSQAQTDAAYLASLAAGQPLDATTIAIIGRLVSDAATIAQALGDVLVALEIVQASEVPGA